jgi:hypothetical protein
MRWLKVYADPIDTWFYYELGDDGYAYRQVELEGTDRSARVAASRSEYQSALRSGSAKDYTGRFGIVAAMPFRVWEDFGGEDMIESDFEEVWDDARRQILSRDGGPQSLSTGE